MSRPHLHFTSLTPRELCGDIVETYRLAAQGLGYPTSYEDGTVVPGVVNVLFFFWGVPWSRIEPLHPDCIVVNLEPMVPGTHAWTDGYREVLQNCYLWEYSQSNFQRNRELGFRNADYVPLGYEEQAAPVVLQAQVLPDAEQDIDVVFFGTLTDRRIAVLHALMAAGVNVTVTRGRNWSIEERDAYLRRAKVVLNLHNWDNSRVVESARLSILLRQHKAVVCELYPDSEIDPRLRSAVVGASYDALVPTVQALLADAPRRAALERAGLDALRRISQADALGPALERYLQWRSQQQMAMLAPLSVAACLHVEAWTPGWALTLATLAKEVHRPQLVIATQSAAEAELRHALEALGWTDARVQLMPDGTDTAAAQNWALQATHTDAVLVCQPGLVADASRLQRLASFLASQPQLDVVSHWLRGAAGASDEPILRWPELDHELKAELFSSTPLQLQHCLVRRAFLIDNTVRHDAEFVHQQGLHLLCKCAAAGARFGVLPHALAQAGTEPAQPSIDADAAGRMAARARRPWMHAALPHLTQDEFSLLDSLYAHRWAPDANFSLRLLRTLAKAGLHSPCAGGSERETLSRLFRREAVRLLAVFAQAELIDQGWTDAAFEDAEIARFLAPVSKQLPFSP